MPIGTALAAAGSFVTSKALPFIAKKAIPALLPKVASAAKAGSKTIAGQLLKTAPKALLGLAKNVGGSVLKGKAGEIAGQLLTKGAPAAFSFGQARKSQGLQNEFQGQIDDLFASAKGRLDTDRFAGLSLPTTGLEMALDTTRQTAGDFLQRVSEGDQRGLASGGRALMAIQEAQQKAGATYDEQLANLRLRQAIGGQQSDAAAAELELGQISGLQAMMADQRKQEAASRMSGIDLLSNLAASLGKKDPFDGEEEEEEVEVDEDNKTMPVSGK
tara:strand:- start:1053 stop:1871 length:819 start_codon:yes stop_codon:yes gene_type:complete